jgi:hypothetical protein
MGGHLRGISPSTPISEDRVVRSANRSALLPGVPTGADRRGQIPLRQRCAPLAGGEHRILSAWSMNASECRAPGSNSRNGCRKKAPWRSLPLRGSLQRGQQRAIQRTCRSRPVAGASCCDVTPSAANSAMRHPSVEGRSRSAPRVSAALAGIVHHSQHAACSQHKNCRERDQQGGLHCQVPLRAGPHTLPLSPIEVEMNSR